MDVATIKNGVQELYIGILGRAADYAGLTYWVNQIALGNLSLDAVRTAFTEQDEYISVYQGLSSAELVMKIYQNVLNREPDEAGLNYWVGELEKDNPISEKALIEAIMNGAKDQPVDAQVLANKVKVADEFTANSVGKKVNADFNEAATNILKKVNDSEDSVKEAQLLSATLNNLLEESFIFREDFESIPLGTFGDNLLLLDAGETAKPVNLTSSAEVVDHLGNQSLQLTLGEGKTNSVYQSTEHFADQKEAYFSYDITYLEGHDWVADAKGPGLGATPKNSPETIPSIADKSDIKAETETETETETDAEVEVEQGFSARSVAKEDGAMYLYVHDQRKEGEAEGEYIPMTLNDEPFKMEIGKAYTVTQQVVMNTPGEANGSVTVTINGDTVLSLTDRMWNESGDLGINTLFIDFWNGGNDDNTESRADSKILIDNIAVSDLPILAQMFEELFTDEAVKQRLLEKQAAEEAVNPKPSNDDILDILRNDVGLGGLDDTLDNSGVNTLLPSSDDFF